MNKKLSVKEIIVITIVAIVLLAAAIWLFQKTTAQSAMNAFDRGDYIAAQEYADKVFIDDFLGAYDEPIYMLYRLTYEYNRWLQKYGDGYFEYEHDLKRCQGMAFSVLDECISYSYLAEMYGCDNQLYQIVVEIGRWLNSYDIDIETELVARFNENGSSSYYPLFKDLREDTQILSVIRKVAQFAESGGVMCLECGNWAHFYMANPISGDIESYCETHYIEIIKAFNNMKADVRGN